MLPSIHPSIHPSIYPTMHLSIQLSIYLSNCPSIYLSNYLSNHLSIYLSNYLSIQLSVLQWFTCYCHSVTTVVVLLSPHIKFLSSTNLPTSISDLFRVVLAVAVRSSQSTPPTTLTERKAQPFERTKRWEKMMAARHFEGNCNYPISCPES
jgi:hypothetical protein